jgi:zinc/manganese transport system permease protein
MSDVFSFLLAPFAACLILVGILGYFGLHILRRKVIFVDLALAQIAALGVVVAFMFDHEPGSYASLSFSLAATILGAALFAWTRTRRERVPQEAIIGITYVIATAATIIVADRAPEGAEHIKELLAGSILWVSWPTVITDLVVCAAVGLIHFYFRRQFILISEDPEQAFTRGMRVRWWDFFFYVTFGVVITLSVQIAGVLMVFAYLVAPAIIAIASSDRWAWRIAIAWSVGLVASVAGLIASYRWDMPSGPAIVCALGLLLVLFAAWRRWVGHRRRSSSAPPFPGPQVES